MCFGDIIFYDVLVIWGFIGFKCMFGSFGFYNVVNWFFLFGVLVLVLFWVLYKIFLDKKWIIYIYIFVFIGVIGMMFFVIVVNYILWFLIGYIFNYLVFKY